MDELVGLALVAVERLAWTGPKGASDPRVGPIHLHFEGGRGLFLSGEPDWTMDAKVTRSGDESWLGPYLHEVENGRWVIRDAAPEQPFAGVLGGRLESWASLRNEVGEQVGMTLDFDTATIGLRLQGGEITT